MLSTERLTFDLRDKESWGVQMTSLFCAILEEKKERINTNQETSKIAIKINDTIKTQILTDAEKIKVLGQVPTGENSLPYKK